MRTLREDMDKGDDIDAYDDDSIRPSRLESGRKAGRRSALSCCFFTWDIHGYHTD